MSGERPDFMRLSEHKALTAKTRYRQQDANCFANEETTSTALDTLSLSFECDQWAVTPGQSVVLYHNEVCLGGGVIWHQDAQATFSSR